MQLSFAVFQLKLILKEMQKINVNKISNYPHFLPSIQYFEIKKHEYL